MNEMGSWEWGVGSRGAEGAEGAEEAEETRGRESFRCNYQLSIPHSPFPILHSLSMSRAVAVIVI
jgi:hypothetical protein